MFDYFIVFALLLIGVSLILHYFRNNLRYLDPYILKQEYLRSNINPIRCCNYVIIKLVIVTIGVNLSVIIIPSIYRLNIPEVYQVLFLLYGMMAMYVHWLFDIAIFNHITFYKLTNKTEFNIKLTLHVICKLSFLLIPTLFADNIITIDSILVTVMFIILIISGIPVIIVSMDRFKDYNLIIVYSNLTNAKIRVLRQEYIKKYGKVEED